MDKQKYSKFINNFKLKTVFFVVGIFILAFSLGVFYEKYVSRKVTRNIINTIKPIRENNFNYNYIYPLLGYDFGEARDYLKNVDLEAKLKNFASEQYKKGKADKISVYYRNFNTAEWAGYNQNDEFQPGSLLKVLIMIGYYREAELNPEVLNKSLIYTKEISNQAESVPYSLPTILEVGNKYPVPYLLDEMISKSDNGAEMLLINNLNRKILNETYTNLSIPNPDSVTDVYTISPIQYVGFLRILYNSTYLSSKYSEEALKIMSNATFKDGIVAGVPTNIKVAQKYGERVSITNNINKIEFHNCGVVYYSPDPYSLCIMTQGKNEDSLKNIIRDISALIFSYQNSK